MTKDRIAYSQCWEDPGVLLSALQVTDRDTVLSITSGGDNTLAILGANPSAVVSVDFKDSQNHLLELKRAAAQRLSYPEYLAFLGVHESKDRMRMFEEVSSALSPEARAWWKAHPELIRIGAVHVGRFERFTAFFAKRILPLIEGRSAVRTLLSLNSAEEQYAFYKKTWDTFPWRVFFGFAASRLLLGRAREQSMFAHTKARNIAITYLNRLKEHLSAKPVEGNFFLAYSLTGTYGTTLPPYLTEEGYARIRTSSSDVRIASSDILSCLKNAPDSSFSKFNLSDVFEALSPAEHEAAWQEILRTAAPGARIVYWINLVPRPVPDSVRGQVEDEEELMLTLSARDRVFFYEGVRIHTIRK